MKNTFLTVAFVLFIGSVSFANNPQLALESMIKSRYDTLIPLQDALPPYDLFEKGLIGYLDLKSEGKNINNDKITLIDFRLSSNKKRMWTIDLKTNKVIYYRLVAHGRNSGNEYAKKFSNIKNSNQSSLGFYLTAENYVGKHGLSLRLDGMEPGFNDKARERAIVMHSASYVNNDFIRNYGRLGRSFGCPAIALNKHAEIIKGLAKGSVIFIYFPDPIYESKTLLNDSEKALAYLSANS